MIQNDQLTMTPGNVANRAQLFTNGKDRGAKFYVMSADDTPFAFKAILSGAAQKKLVSYAGGCKGLTDDVRDSIFPLTAQALTRLDGTTAGGVHMSGGTKEGNVPMVTQIPSYLASLPAFNNIIAVSHTPRTDVLSLQGPTAGLVLNDYGTKLDAEGHHAMLLCQPDMNNNAGWDYDVPTYLKIMTELMAEGWFVVNVIFNGGDVTRDAEIYGALLVGVPVIVVEGTGREADAFVAAFRDGDWTKTAAEMRGKGRAEAADAKIVECQGKLARIKRELVQIVCINDVQALRAAFTKVGIL